MTLRVNTDIPYIESSDTESSDIESSDIESSDTDRDTESSDTDRDTDDDINRDYDIDTDDDDRMQKQTIFDILYFYVVILAIIGMYFLS